jgi:hypothetical protein
VYDRIFEGILAEFTLYAPNTHKYGSDQPYLLFYVPHAQHALHHAF